MGRRFHSTIVLGAHLLREPQSKGGVPQRCHSRPRIQVDSSPLSLLGRPCPLRRISLSRRASEAPFPNPQIRREDFIICLRSASGRGFDSLRPSDDGEGLRLRVCFSRACDDVIIESLHDLDHRRLTALGRIYRENGFPSTQLHVRVDRWGDSRRALGDVH